MGHLAYPQTFSSMHNVTRAMFYSFDSLLYIPERKSYRYNNISTAPLLNETWMKNPITRFFSNFTHLTSFCIFKI